MTKKEALIKAFFWRFIISVPLTTTITYLYFGELFHVFQFVVIMNAVMTAVYFLFEMIWPFFFAKFFKPK